MGKNVYKDYPEGFNKLAEDLKMPMDDPFMKKFMLTMLDNTIANNLYLTNAKKSSMSTLTCL